MLKNNKIIGLISAGFIGVGSVFSGAAVTGIVQETTVYAAADVAINAENFPDKNFRKYVSDNVDKDKNGKLSEKEISACKKIDCRGKDILSLKGIEFFTGLKDLNCLGNNLSTLDLSKNVSLDSLNCEVNVLTKLDVSKNVALEYLYCTGNELKTLDISKNVALKDLRCSGNELSNLDVSKNKKLEILYCYGNKLKKLDVRNNTALEELHCIMNDISELDVSKNAALKSMSISTNALTSLDVSKNKSLTGVDSENQYKDVTCKNGEIILSDMDPAIKPANITNLKGATLSGGKFVNITGNTITYDYKIGYKNQKMNVTLNVKGVKKNGWKKEGNGWKYYKDNKAYTGWHWMTSKEGEKTPHWSYFGKDGIIYTGWRYMGKNEREKTSHWSYFGADGWLRTGWQQMGKGTVNSFGENSTKHWSYFGENGWLRTGWQAMGKGTGNSYGENNSKHWSYFGANGWLRTSWQAMGKGTGNSYGENTTKHWSYFGANGWLRTGMQTMGTNINPDGKNRIHISYFGGNGWLVTNKIFTLNKKQYTADSKGWATEVKTEHEKTLVRAMQLVDKVTNNSMTKEQKLRACYVYIRDSYPEYNPRIPHFAGQGWHITYANDIFVGKDGRKGGNCISVGAAFAYMAKAIGYENVYAVNGTGHGWAEVDNKVYDAEWERHHKGSYYAVNYNDTVGTQKYKWIFSSSNPYARIKL